MTMIAFRRRFCLVKLPQESVSPPVILPPVCVLCVRENPHAHIPGFPGRQAIRPKTGVITLTDRANSGASYFSQKIRPVCVCTGIQLEEDWLDEAWQLDSQ
jgi:hypothetical protein